MVAAISCGDDCTMYSVYETATSTDIVHINTRDVCGYNRWPGSRQSTHATVAETVASIVAVSQTLKNISEAQSLQLTGLAEKKTLSKTTQIVFKIVKKI